MVAIAPTIVLKTKQVLLPDETHRALKSVCARRGVSMMDTLNTLVLEYVAQAQTEDRAAFVAAEEEATRCNREFERLNDV